MAEYTNVIFGDEQLFNNIKKYAQGRKLTFSRALQELSAAGLRFHEKSNSLNVDLIFEKNKNLKSITKAYETVLKRMGREIGDPPQK